MDQNVIITHAKCTIHKLIKFAYKLIKVAKYTQSLMEFKTRLGTLS